jgi:hypothetical protein
VASIASGLEQKREEGREFDREMRGESARHRGGAGPIEEDVELVLQMSTRDSSSRRNCSCSRS